MVVIILEPEGLVRASEQGSAREDQGLFLLRSYSLDEPIPMGAGRGWTDSFASYLGETCAVSRIDMNEVFSSRPHDDLLDQDWKFEVLERTRAARLTCYAFNNGEDVQSERPLRNFWSYGLPFVDFGTAIPRDTRSTDWEFLLGCELSVMSKSVLLVPRRAEVPFDFRTPAINSVLLRIAEENLAGNQVGPLWEMVLRSGVWRRVMTNVTASPLALAALEGNYALPSPDLSAMLFAIASPAMFQFGGDVFLLHDGEPVLSPENASRFVAARIRLTYDPDFRDEIVRRAACTISVEARLAPRIELRHKIWSSLLHYLWSRADRRGYDKRLWNTICSALTQSDQAVYGMSSEDLERAHGAVCALRKLVVGEDEHTARRYDLLASFLRSRDTSTPT